MDRDVTIIRSSVLFRNGWPSQWHAGDFDVDGIRYNCCEQFMMAKARVFGDSTNEAAIIDATTPRQQKRPGRSLQGFDEDLRAPAHRPRRQPGESP